VDSALPLGGAFLLAKRRPSRRFTYGYGRAEDPASERNKTVNRFERARDGELRENDQSVV